MNEAWESAYADAHQAKAEALEQAIGCLEGLDGALDNIESPVIRNAVALLERARERHERAGKLLALT